MSNHTPAWKWVLGLLIMAIGAATTIPLYRYADRDDAPGGMVIAVVIFLGAAALATWVVSRRAESLRR